MSKDPEAIRRVARSKIDFREHNAFTWARKQREDKMIDMPQEQETCRYCNDPIQWVKVRFGHGPDYKHKRVAIGACPGDGRIIFDNGEWVMKRKSAIANVPDTLRFRAHGYLNCVKGAQD
jgi:hypothetical protein